MGDPIEILSETEIAQRVDRLAAEIAPRITDDTIVVCLLTGGLWFAADLTRALYRQGRNLKFDALWIASYGDEHVSSGRVLLRAGLQRPVAGLPVLVIDDVMDSGLSLLEAVRLLKDAGAASVLTAVFARKPWPEPRAAQCDFVAWEAPARFLAGYGMDAGGQFRGLPGVAALD
jgi:hypoxanthine phosphoribosyltransferase